MLVNGKFDFLNFLYSLIKKLVKKFNYCFFRRFAGRWDCGCEYVLSVWLTGNSGKLLAEKAEERRILQWEGNEWHKVKFEFLSAL